MEMETETGYATCPAVREWLRQTNAAGPRARLFPAHCPLTSLSIERDTGLSYCQELSKLPCLSFPRPSSTFPQGCGWGDLKAQEPWEMISTFGGSMKRLDICENRNKPVANGMIWWTSVIGRVLMLAERGKPWLVHLSGHAETRVRKPHFTDIKAEIKLPSPWWYNFELAPGANSMYAVFPECAGMA